MLRRLFGCLFVATIMSLLPLCAFAYPEFQAFIEKNSGRTVNCAMCHTNPDGPIGDAEGQLGSLKPEQMEKVNKARAAIEPGVEVNSPILNEFGNLIIKNIGMKGVLAAKANPKLLADALGNKGDLDGDGISDAQEILQGTHPQNKFHGDSYALFINNAMRSKFHIVMALIATVLIIYGFLNFIKALNILSERKNKR